MVNNVWDVVNDDDYQKDIAPPISSVAMADCQPRIDRVPI